MECVNSVALQLLQENGRQLNVQLRNPHYWSSVAISFNVLQENGNICCPMPNSSNTRSEKRKVEFKDTHGKTIGHEL
jgi:hypothetical protein